MTDMNALPISLKVYEKGFTIEHATFGISIFNLEQLKDDYNTNTCTQDKKVLNLYTWDITKFDNKVVYSATSRRRFVRLITINDMPCPSGTEDTVGSPNLLGVGTGTLGVWE